MKNRKITVAVAAMGTLIILTLCGTLAARTVFAAEERISITGENSGTAIQAYTDAEVQKVYKKEIYKDTGCTMVLPTGYVASDSIKGMYVAERHPLDSSNIYYTVSENIDTEALRTSMNYDDYKNQTEKKFKEAYGADAAVSSYKFEKTQIDGCPAYKIRLSCTLGDMTMEQLIYVIAADKAYTITYSQASDDERMSEFEASADTIRMVFE